MKKMLLLMILVLLFGCEQMEEAKRNRKIKAYQKARELALNDTVVVEDIFLTFKFGDSEREFNRKRKALYKGKKLNKNHDWDIEYENHSGELKKASFFLMPEFHNNKLSVLKLVSKTEDGFDKFNLWYYMFKIILEKYYSKNSLLDQKYGSAYSGLVHNLEIKLYSNIHDQVIIEYIDLRVENEIKQVTTEKDIINQAKNADDL